MVGVDIILEYQLLLRVINQTNTPRCHESIHLAHDRTETILYPAMVLQAGVLHIINRTL